MRILLLINMLLISVTAFSAQINNVKYGTKFDPIGIDSDGTLFGREGELFNPSDILSRDSLSLFKINVDLTRNSLYKPAPMAFPSEYLKGADSHYVGAIAKLHDGSTLVMQQTQCCGFGNTFGFLHKSDAAGKVDPQFGNKGTVVFGSIDPDRDYRLFSNLTELPSGNIVGLERRCYSSVNGLICQIYLFQLTPNGKLDSTFGTAGFVRLDDTDSFSGPHFRIVPFEKGIAYYNLDFNGWSPQPIKVRLTASKINSKGVVEIDRKIISVNLDKQCLRKSISGFRSSLLVTYACENAIKVLRYSPSGDLDLSFGAGSSGIAIIPVNLEQDTIVGGINVQEIPDGISLVYATETVSKLNGEIRHTLSKIGSTRLTENGLSTKWGVAEFDFKLLGLRRDPDSCEREIRMKTFTDRFGNTQNFVSYPYLNPAENCREQTISFQTGI